MTVKHILNKAKDLLAANGIEDAYLESELLLRHTLNIDRVQLYLGIDNESDASQEEAFWEFIRRRIQGEPSAYITGHREFYGYDFTVCPGVLIPRPESELLVDRALNFSRQYPVKTIADIGTGCGALAVSMALTMPKTRIYATDISAIALETARNNAEKHGVSSRISFLQGDLLEPLPEAVDIIVANLPYVRKEEIPAAGPLSFEPPLALDGGTEGLDKIDSLCRQAGAKLLHEGCLLLEIGWDQAKAVTGLLQRLFPSARIESFSDLSGIERVISVIPIGNSTERF